MSYVKKSGFVGPKMITSNKKLLPKKASVAAEIIGRTNNVPS
jgi:hypothetical protein